MARSDARTTPGRRRPFGAGLALALGGAEILLVQRAGPAELVTAEVRYVVPLLMVVCGVLVVTDPRRRRPYAVVGVLASLASWVASDLGGLLLGAALGIVGGALAVGGAPDPAPPGSGTARPPGPA
ncbi:hypothetical protein SNE510_54450 [Streptomyces sp. NE5-10]|uniref:DUF6114 domain-containing protein n=1 Tax=Streptomyces sp. NE5-10 TaxID=2759674 RepID=UPI001905B050|nr:DUF6114 domain-containing protein [Streptomyces sp. NE5-10]GHJ95926.1 hypothetical protein SNE510_54450 [Streptomyces sp. NE5-10]